VKVLVETGVVGLVLFLWLLAKMYRLGYRVFRAAKEPFWAAIGLGFLTMLVSGIFLNFFGDRWTYQQVTGFFWILLGCVIRGWILVREEEVTARSAAAPRLADVPAEAVTA